MSKINQVWIFAEKQSFLAQLAAGGRQLGEKVTAIIVGNREEAEKAIKMGADKVYWLGNPQEGQMLEDYTDTILQLIKKEKPGLLMMQPTKRGKLIAGRLAASLETSVMVDACSIEIIDNKVQVTHMVYGGGAFRIEKATSDTAIVTVGSGVYAAMPEDETRQGSIQELNRIEQAAKVKLVEKKSKGSIVVNLEAAKRVIGIGRGIANQEDIRIVEELAGLIDAEIGCSRPLAEGVDWLPRERYIGVSGAMLKPDVYFCVGISGQVQHMVGVNQARVIVAINKDKNAPIFQQADFGIVGDLYKVVPGLIEKFKSN
jgi:electron transfer flavoprotein alpha subunit